MVADVSQGVAGSRVTGLVIARCIQGEIGIHDKAITPTLELLTWTV
jgi:hypothetical protein